ncbi:MAG: hypothetical protein LBT40_17080 [Deltaproteobacteria bacterium]|jgi:hypothetical protein|nr:hypothetical protein [Deltaproteobacteria bacterium]
MFFTRTYDTADPARGSRDRLGAARGAAEEDGAVLVVSCFAFFPSGETRTEGCTSRDNPAFSEYRKPVFESLEFPDRDGPLPAANDLVTLPGTPGHLRSSVPTPDTPGTLRASLPALGTHRTPACLRAGTRHSRSH